jgi:chromate transporter
MKDLFLTFFKIGAFTLGGGYAMVPLLEREVVDKHEWLSKENFMDIMAVSQATPGLFAINMASHIGNKIGGVKAALVCSIGVALPSIISILLIAMFFTAFKGNIYIEKIFRGIRPAVVALIVSPCFSMARTAKLDKGTIWIPIVACILIVAFGVSPIWIILIAIMLGFIVGKMTNNS